MSEVDERFSRARARFNDGLAALQARRYEDAERGFLDALELVPGRPSALGNLAAVRLLLGRPAEALAAAEQALAAEPGHRDALWQRAQALRELGRLPEARAILEALVATEPRLLPAWAALAQTLGALGRVDDALAASARVLALDERDPGHWTLRGDLLRQAERPAEAAQAFRESLARGGDAALNRYYLAAVDRTEPAPPTAPTPYVRGLFDSYAEDFDRHLLGALRYEVPERLTRGLADHGPFERALDIGCGTGLCGPHLRPLARHLVGVDLSRPMLEKASALGCYDELRLADATEHLHAQAARGPHYDLLVAADVFIYVGALDPLFAAARVATRAGALFCFSAEEPEAPELDVQLLPSLRYAHGEAYLRRVAAVHGFETLALRRETIRHDQQRPVEGLYVWLKRR